MKIKNDLESPNFHLQLDSCCIFETLAEMFGASLANAALTGLKSGSSNIDSMNMSLLKSLQIHVLKQFPESVFFNIFIFFSSKN